MAESSQKREMVEAESRIEDIETANWMNLEACLLQPKIQVMGKKRLNNKNHALPVWIWGAAPAPLENGMQSFESIIMQQLNPKLMFHCVDIMKDDMYSQALSRLSLLQKDTDSPNKKRKRPPSPPNFAHDFINVDKPHLTKGLRIYGDLSSEGILESSVPVAVGSRLYFIGGCKCLLLDTTIHCVDTKALHLGWTKYHMKVGRAFPNVTAINGKIYIVGGSNRPEGQCIDGEIFDTHSGLSVLMADAPSEHGDVRDFLAFLPESREILFLAGVTGCFLCYNVDRDKWRVEYKDDQESRENFNRIYKAFKRSLNVGSGKTMYWFSYESYRLSALDFSTMKFYESERSLEKILKKWGVRLDCEICTVGFLHLRDDYFCLIWRDVPDTGDTYYQRFLCIKFRIYIGKDNKYLRTSFFSAHSYLSEPQFGVMSAIAMPSTISH